MEVPRDIESVQRGRAHDAHEGRHRPAAALAPGEEEVLPADRDRADGPLGDRVVDREATITQVSLELLAVREDV